jgi:hypothetical protein
MYTESFGNTDAGDPSRGLACLAFSPPRVRKRWILPCPRTQRRCLLFLVSDAPGFMGSAT